jgi:hypothetical protein
MSQIYLYRSNIIILKPKCAILHNSGVLIAKILLIVYHLCEGEESVFINKNKGKEYGWGNYRTC